ncbi:MAG: OmpA family protein [Pseudomonadota bacterium]
MKKIAIASAALLLASAFTVQAQEVYDNRWYAGITGGVTSLDDDRLSDEDWPYYGVYIGRFLSPNFSLDFRIDNYRGQFEESEFDVALADDEIDMFSYGLVGRYHFGDNDKFRPYILAAVGIQEHENIFADGRDAYASLGFGANSYLTDNWRLGAELEGRYDNDRDTFDDRNNGFIDLILSMNLSFAFGERPRPVVAQQAEPAPPPPVRPAPRPTPPPPPPPAEPEVLFEFDSEVTFGFDSAEIRPSAEPELNRAAAILSERTEIVLIEVAGHTDSSGPEDYNQNLSERRAQAVADYLAARGVDHDRMEVRGFGETRPKVPNDTRENRQMNRRVVVTILERG